MSALRAQLALLALAGCVDGNPPLPDAVVVAVDAAPRPDAGGDYDDPSDFVRFDCVPGSLAGLDPVGQWTFDLRVGGRHDVQVVQILPGGQVHFNHADHPYQLSADDLFFRSPLDIPALTVDACAIDQDGLLSGLVASCSGGVCELGTFQAGRVARRAGEAEASGLTLVSAWNPGWDGIPVNVRVDGERGVAYLADLAGGLRVVDVGDPAAPADLANRRSPAGGYNDVKLITRQSDGRHFALLAIDTVGVDIYDVEEPAAPLLVAHVGESSHTVFVDGTRAYFPDGLHGDLAIADLSDPAAPQLLGRYRDPRVGELGGFIHDLYVADGVAYLAYWNLGLVLVDVSDPAAPTALGVFDAYPRRTSHSVWVTRAAGCKVALLGDEDWDAHLRIIGVDPACPADYLSELGAWSLGPQVSIHNIMATGTTATIAHYQYGVRQVSVADPAAPLELAYFNSWQGTPGVGFFEGAVGVDVDPLRRLVYVADIPLGLLILQGP